MTILKSPLVFAMKPLLGNSKVQRYFTEFTGSNSFYIEIPPITLPTNTPWVLRVVAAVPNEGAYLLANHTKDDSQSRFGLLNDGRTFGLSNDSNNIGGDTQGMKGGNQLRTLEAVNNGGGTITITINEVQVNAFNDGTLAPVLDSIGRQFNGQTGVPPMEGVISLVQIEVDGVVLLDMPINGNYTPENNIVTDISGNGNHGTFQGIFAGASELYTQNNESHWETSTKLLKTS